jgi:hypothetical protein
MVSHLLFVSGKQLYLQKYDKKNYISKGTLA